MESDPRTPPVLRAALRVVDWTIAVAVGAYAAAWWLQGTTGEPWDVGVAVAIGVLASAGAYLVIAVACVAFVMAAAPSRRKGGRDV